MATKKTEAPSTVEAFILRDCAFGKACEVVTLSSADAEIGVLDGAIDLTPAAIAHAKSLKE